MGLIGKIKNILFEEEEVEIPVIKNEEKEPVKSVVEEKKQDDYVNDFPTFDELEQKTTQKKEEKEVHFDFPAFDEDEFNDVMPKLKPKEPEIELPKRSETPKVSSYTSKYSNIDVKSSYEIKKEEPKKKFRPSPNISPVYGILDKDYKPVDTPPRKVEEKKIVRPGLDVDKVRKKAFGEMPQEEYTKDIEVTENLIKKDIINEKKKYNELKGKTIDELLESASDDVVEVAPKKEVKPEVKNESIPKNNDSLEVLDKAKEADFEEDTLENDLFNLIDSMYEDRKGE